MKEIKIKANNLLEKMELLDSDEEIDLTLDNIWKDIKKFLKEVKGEK